MNMHDLGYFFDSLLIILDFLGFVSLDFVAFYFI